MDKDLYCKVFIDTNLSYDKLFSIILEYVGGKKEALTYISTDWCEINIQKNKEYEAKENLLDTAEFLYWKYYLDIEPNRNKESVYIKKVSDLLGYLRIHCNGVIAACDFEDELDN